MEVISFSVDEDLLADAEQVMEEMGFDGRSRFIRAAMRSLIDEKRQHDGLTGDVEAVLVLTHDEGAGSVTGPIHSHEDMIETHLHSHLDDDRCLDLLVVDGKADRVRELWTALRTQQAVRDVTLLPF